MKKEKLTYEEFKLDLLRSLELISRIVKSDFNILLKNKDLYNEFFRLYHIYENVELRKHYNNVENDIYLNQHFFDNTMKFLNWKKIKNLKKSKFSLQTLIQKIKIFLKNN